MNTKEACAILGVSPEADPEALRKAYLAQLTAHPPEEDSEAFEQIRDAYKFLQDPLLRARQILEIPGSSPQNQIKAHLQYVGPEPWLALLKEKRPC